MAAISINLLPQELENTKKDRAKQFRAIQISIGILVLVIGIATFVLIIRVSQNVSLSDLKKKDTTLTSKIKSTDNNLKDGLVRSLKDRTGAFTAIEKKESAGSYAYALITKIKPADVLFEEVSLDKKSNLILSGKTTSIASLEELLNNITNNDVTSNKIIHANIDSLSQDPKGLYKFELTVTLIGGEIKKS